MTHSSASGKPFFAKDVVWPAVAMQHHKTPLDPPAYHYSSGSGSQHRLSGMACRATKNRLQKPRCRLPPAAGQHSARTWRHQELNSGFTIVLSDAAHAYYNARSNPGLRYFVVPGDVSHLTPTLKHWLLPSQLNSKRFRSTEPSNPTSCGTTARFTWAELARREKPFLNTKPCARLGYGPPRWTACGCTLNQPRTRLRQECPRE